MLLFLFSLLRLLGGIGWTDLCTGGLGHMSGARGDARGCKFDGVGRGGGEEVVKK